MKINLNFKTSILFTVLLLVSFLANAQKKMWTGKSYNFTINNATNVGSTKAWTLQGLQGVNLTGGSTTTNTNSYTNTFTLTGSTALTDTLQVSETLTNCVTTNKLGITVFPLPILDSSITNTSCATQASIPTTLAAKVNNFSTVKSITSSNFTLTYQLYDGSNNPISGITGTLTLPAGTASVDSISLSTLQIGDLYTYLNNPSTSVGTYKLKINNFQTPLTPTSTEAGAVAAILATIRTFTINALPVSNPIIAN
jgi:hypothetical protein